MKPKIGILLIQLGTPGSPSVNDVRKYLYEFLNDPRVIDVSWIIRKLLVNTIIVPFRAPKSVKIYKRLWTEGGSPLLICSERVKNLLQKELGENYKVELAMRYQNPSLNDVLKRMNKFNYEEIIILPLFPQYTSASTGSSIEKAVKIICDWQVIPNIKIINGFYDNKGFIDSFVQRAGQYNVADFEYVLFSYHGLPVRQVGKIHPEGKTCDDFNCDKEINDENKFCYKAACYATTRLIAGRLNIPREKYTVCFQSRLDKKWLEPFTDKIVIQKAKEGIKKLLVFSPAFVTDCLETIVEIGFENKRLFLDNGGKELQLVESLNDYPVWIKALKNIVLKSR